MTGLSLEELAGFAAVARSRSFSAAARQQFVTQSAVSRRVSRLERAVGCRLLDRTSHTVELTAAGARLLLAVEPALAAMANVERVAARERIFSQPDDAVPELPNERPLAG